MEQNFKTLVQKYKDELLRYAGNQLPVKQPPAEQPPAEQPPAKQTFAEQPQIPNMVAPDGITQGPLSPDNREQIQNDGTSPAS